MFERLRRPGRSEPGQADQGAGRAPAAVDDRRPEERADAGPGRGPSDDRAVARGGVGDHADGGSATGARAEPRHAHHPVDEAAAGTVVLDEHARLRQRERFGGYNWGAAFFGWLVAVGIAALLTAIVAAAGAAIGLTNASSRDVNNNAGTIGVVGGVVLLVILLLAYYAGGYVAGRMSRFDGARQGFAAWLIGVVITIVLAVAGAIFGSQYNVLTQLRLPRIPIDEGSLTTGGAIALAAIVIGTLVAALAGGKVGQLYHRRVDREALVD